MKFTRSTAGCSLLNHRRSEEILEEVNIETVEKISTV
jgi:hypothetical protein